MMKYILFIQEEAIEDLKEVYDWYESKQSGLGAAFIEAVEMGYDLITDNPFFYGYFNEHIVVF